jgi:hypothetical protein
MSFSFYESLSRHIPGLRSAKQAIPAAVSHLPLPAGFLLYGRPYFR